MPNLGVIRSLLFTLASLSFAEFATPRIAVLPSKIGLASQLRRPAAAPGEDTHSAVACNGALHIGLRIHSFSTGLRAAIWYPTIAAELPYTYPGRFRSTVAQDAPVASCGQKFPLLVFSHGFDGCGIQSVFLTEALARAGYIVVAPDHRDAACQVDQPVRILKLLNRADAPTRQHDLSDNSYRYRLRDVETVINEMLADQRFAPAIDAARIGGLGHSLGGYTMLGLAGGWPSWRDNRIKAILLLSPFLTPYIQTGSLRDIHIPVMYQGGTRDFTITPDMRHPGGAYELSRPPKYYVEIEGAGHLDWSNLACSFQKYIPACAQNVPKVRQIDSYGIAFFNRYLKEMKESLLDRPNSALADFRHSN